MNLFQVMAPFHAYKGQPSMPQRLFSALFAPIRAAGTAGPGSGLRAILGRIFPLILLFIIVYSILPGGSSNFGRLAWHEIDPDAPLPTGDSPSKLPSGAPSPAHGAQQPVVNAEEPTSGVLDKTAGPLLGPAPPTPPAPLPVTDPKDLPICGCSASVDDGQWTLRGDTPELAQIAVSTNPLLDRFDRWDISTWDGNCTAEMKALYTTWRPRTCRLYDPYFGQDSQASAASEATLAGLHASGYPKRYLPPDVNDRLVRISARLVADPVLFKLFGNKRIATIGDSLMAQFSTGIKKFFPLSSIQILSPHDKKPSPDVSVPRWIDPPAPWGFNVSVDFLRFNQPGPEFPGMMEYIFDSGKYDVILINFGIWYNQQAKPDEVRVRAIRQGNLTGFTPLTATHYKEDMERFANAFKDLRARRSPQGRWPIVIWGESTPQHFQNGSFTWNVLQDSPPASGKEKLRSECFPYESLEDYMRKGHWRNEMAQPIVDEAGLPTMHFSKALHSLHSCHPFRYNAKKDLWGNDCTHYCEPSIKTVVGHQIFVGCLKELVDKRST